MKHLTVLFFVVVGIAFVSARGFDFDDFNPFHFDEPEEGCHGEEDHFEHEHHDHEHHHHDDNPPPSTTAPPSSSAASSTTATTTTTAVAAG